MKQVVQDLASKEIRVVDVPTPVCPPGGVVVRVVASLVSSGTERSKASVTQQSLPRKALERRDLVSQTIQKARVEGILPTVRLVQERLASMQTLGYSCAGVVTEVHTDVDSFRVGDLVACAGEGFANHAEYVGVPATLVARAQTEVDPVSAAFSAVASIGLHAIHQARVEPGHRVGVVGLGLVGRLTLRELSAYGCSVVGVDVGLGHCAYEAALSGVTLLDLDGWAAASLSLDSVIVCASSADDELLNIALDKIRDRGRLVLVGVAPLNLDRKRLYDREIEVSVSRSYGAGRYDPSYEDSGVDYPEGYARWTIARNLAEFLRLLSEGRLTVADMVDREVPIADAPRLYSDLVSGNVRVAVLRMSDQGSSVQSSPLIPIQSAAPKRSRTASPPVSSMPRVGVIGPGNFARRVLIPALKASGAELATVCSTDGLSARSVAERHGFRGVCASPEAVMDSGVDAVVVATRHSTHASLVQAALERGLPIFVEKPLAVNRSELEAIEAAAFGRPEAIVVPGFNRRLSPSVISMNSWFARGVGSTSVSIEVNAGRLPPDSWALSADEGGRLVGEVCHFVDLARFLSSSTVIRSSISASGGTRLSPSRSVITLEHANGSVSNIVYQDDGASSYPKERVTVHRGGKSAEIRDFRTLDCYPTKLLRVPRRSRQDKGHSNLISAFVRSVSAGGPPPIELADAIETHRLLFDLVDQM